MAERVVDQFACAVPARLACNDSVLARGHDLQQRFKQIAPGRRHAVQRLALGIERLNEIAALYQVVARGGLSPPMLSTSGPSPRATAPPPVFADQPGRCSRRRSARRRWPRTPGSPRTGRSTPGLRRFHANAHGLRGPVAGEPAGCCAIRRAPRRWHGSTPAALLRATALESCAEGSACQRPGRLAGSSGYRILPSCGAAHGRPDPEHLDAISIWLLVSLPSKRAICPSSRFSSTLWHFSGIDFGLEDLDGGPCRIGCIRRRETLRGPL